MVIQEVLDDIASSSATDVVSKALKRAEAVSDHNVFISLTKDRALERAKAVDAGKITGRLAGVPFAVKDNYLTLGAPTTAASNILSNFEASIQATAIEKLEAEGAILIGKTNLDAFAHGGSTENSAYGPTKNAHNKKRVAGGSSGGSAVAVALDVVPFSLGSDTGGSIRQPASFNGVLGVKPTYGTVSRFGVIAMASSTDTMGCFTSTVKDAELVMDIMAGRDVNDMTTLPDFFTPIEKSGVKRVGIIREFLGEGVDDAVKVSVEDYIATLREKGIIVEEVTLPIVKYVLAMYYIIVPAEISSNLARYDGVRYGKRAESKTLDDLYEKSRSEGFEAENKRRIMIGNFVLSSGYFDAYYRKASQARTLLMKDFAELFEEYDALIGPVSPTTAFEIGERSDDPVSMYMADIMTVPASLAGLPAISVPAGKDKNDMPIGVQIIGPPQSDAKLLALARETKEY